MTGRITSITDGAVTAPVVRPVLLAEFDFADGYSRCWSGVGTLSWSGHTWQGVGTLGSVEDVEETTELRAVGVRFRLSGIPSNLLESVTTTVVQGRRAKLWLGFMSETWVMLDQPVLILSGKMDTVDITDGGSELSFELAVENNLRDLQRPRVRRYTDADQQSEFAGDKGFEFVSELQRKEFKWGTKAPPPAPTTWSASDKAAGVTLTTSLLGASGSGAVRATEDEYFFELFVVEGTAAAGFSEASRDISTIAFDGSLSWGSSQIASNKTIGVALTDGNMYVGIDGQWPRNDETGEWIAAATHATLNGIPTAILSPGAVVTAKFDGPWWHGPPSWMARWLAGEGGAGDGSDSADPGPGTSDGTAGADTDGSGGIGIG